MKRIVFAFVASFMAFTHVCFAAYSIGISPPSLYLGELEKGSSELVSFTLITPSDRAFLVYLDAYNPDIDFIMNKYPDITDNLSEQESSTWVEFVSNPIQTEQAGHSERSWEDVDFFLRIPENAEPGYHVITVKPSLYLADEASGEAGAMVTGVTTFTVNFYVSGMAERSGMILDVVKASQTGTAIFTDTYFQNTGTVTVSARAFQIIANEYEAQSASEKVMPGETKTLMVSFYPDKPISQGNHSISTVVDYVSSSCSLETTMIISPSNVTHHAMPGQTEAYDIIPIAALLAFSLAAIFYMRRRK